VSVLGLFGITWSCWLAVCWLGTVKLSVGVFGFNATPLTLKVSVVVCP
jgi:hypothetical protein